MKKNFTRVPFSSSSSLLLLLLLPFSFSLLLPKVEVQSEIVFRVVWAKNTIEGSSLILIQVDNLACSEKNKSSESSLNTKIASFLYEDS